MPYLICDDGGHFLDDGARRFFDSQLKFFCDECNGVPGFPAIAERNDSFHNHGVRGRGERPVQCGSRPFPLRSDQNFAVLNSDDAVTAHTDGFCVETANQRFSSVDFHAGWFEKGNPVGKNGDIRRGTADIQSHGIFFHAGGCENTHNTGRRSGVNSLYGAVQGLINQDRSAVSFQNVHRNIQSKFLDKFLDIPHKSLINLMNSCVEIRCGNAAGEIQLSRQCVSQRNFSGIVLKQFSCIQLLLGIS